jgi:hypothetical protein
MISSSYLSARLRQAEIDQRADAVAASPRAHLSAFEFRGARLS